MASRPRSTLGMQPLRRGVLAVLLVLVTATLTWLYAHEGHEPLPTKGAKITGNNVQLSPEARKALGVRTAEVDQRTLERTVLAPATVVLAPNAHAFATSQLPGRVEQVLVKPGQAVRAGDTVALIRSLELERLVLELTTSRLDLELAEQVLARDEALGGAISQNALQATRSRRQERVNAHQVARLKLQAIGVNYPESDAPGSPLLPVHSPITGVVAHADINPGMIVEPQQHLLDIVDASRLRVRAEVPEAYVPQIALGNEAYLRLSAFADRKESLRGVVRAREDRINSHKLAETVWIDLTSPDVPLAPGMAGQVQIVVERAAKAMAVPEAAFVRDGMESYVFVQTAPGEYRRTPLVTGLAANGFVQAKGGLLPGDAVLVQGNRQLASFFVQGVLRPGKEARINTGLRVEPVAARPIASTLTFDAVVELPTQNKATVASPLTGKIVDLLVTQPQQVSQGQPLARVASLEIQNLQLDLIRADLNAKLLNDTLERYRKVDPSERNVIPRQLIEEAKMNLQVAEARVKSLSQQLSGIGLTPEEIQPVLKDQKVTGSFTLRSPKDGHAIPAELAPGQVVKAGEPLFVIQDRSRVWIRSRVPEQDVRSIKVGQPARLRLASDANFLAETHITRIDSLPEADGRSRAVWAELDNVVGQLREHTLGRLTVVVGSPREATAVPVSAVHRDGSHTGVFVYEEKQDRFALRPVQLGRRDDRYIGIVSGVQIGDPVAVTAVPDLRRGLGRIK